MAWKYKDLLDAGRGGTVREVRDDEMIFGLDDGYSAVGRYDAQDVNRVGYRGDYGVADNAFMNDEDWNAVQRYKAQYEQAKAAGDQAGMNAAHEAAQQLRYKYGYSGGEDGSEYRSIAAYTDGLSKGLGLDGVPGGAGGYMSQYESRIDSLLDAILNREAFSYDKDQDPLYQQYKESYTRGGKLAMQDVLAELSARTGGLASSYAGGASQQTFNNYMAQLADKVPELQQLAYSMYLDELNNDRMDLETLLGMDDTQYGRYRDGVADQQWQQQFDYNASRDKVSDSQWQQQFDRNAAMDDREWAYKLLQDGVVDGSVSDWRNTGKRGGWYDNGELEPAQVKDPGMNEDHFRASMQSIAQQLAANKQDAAEGNVNRIWDQLSEEQRQQLSELLDKYGLMTE